MTQAKPLTQESTHDSTQSRTQVCFRVRTFAYVLLTYVLYTLRTFAYVHLHTYFCIRTFGIRTFHRTYVLLQTYICIRILRTYFCRTYFIPYVFLHTNFRVRTFAYVLLTYVFYPLRIFVYEHLRTYFFPTYFSDTYFGPTIVCRLPSPCNSTTPFVMRQRSYIYLYLKC